MKVAIVKPLVTVSGLDLGNSVDSIEIVSSVNQIPTVKLSVHKTEGAVSVQAPLTTDYIDSIADIQADRITGDASPEVTVTISTTGDDNSEYTFIGMPIGPEASVSDRMFTSGIRLLHSVSKLNVLQPYVYSAVPGAPGNQVEQGLDQTVVADSTEASGGNFMKRLYVLLEERIEQFEKLISQAGWIDGATQTYVADLHARNKSVLGLLFTLTFDSDEPTYETLEQVISDPIGELYVNRAINNFVGSYLATSREDFLSNLFGFLNATQCYYAPPSLGRPGDYLGRVRPYRTMVNDDDILTKEASPNFIGIASADTKIDVVNTVMVTSVPAAPRVGDVTDQGAHSYIPADLNFSTFMVVGGGSPEGNAVTVPIPPWIPSYFMELVRSPSDNQVDTTLDIAAYKAKRDGIKQKVQNIYANEFDKILREYATNVLYDLQYAPYTVLMRIPLDMSWEVGVRSRVLCRRSAGDLEFTGFLQSVAHNIVSQKGAESAYTTLTFTHIKY